MSATETLYSFENQVFLQFAKYGILVIVKMMAMSMVTTIFRITLNVYRNAEDAKLVTKDADQLKAALSPNETVERIRRIHANDIENVVSFVLIGLLYVATKPGIWTATIVFQIFAASRYGHTFCYYYGIGPFRSLTFLIGYAANCFMAVSVILNAWMY